MARARPRPSRSSRATGAPDGGEARVLGVDPATGGPGASGARRADAPGRRHRPARPAARDAPPVRPLPRRSARRRRAARPRRAPGGRRTRYRRLSGGERQRLGLALALVGRPEVVILDEPTAGMDPEARATTRAIVADLRDAGAAILLTSHDLTDVERLADRICVLDGGRIVAAGRRRSQGWARRRARGSWLDHGRSRDGDRGTGARARPSPAGDDRRPGWRRRPLSPSRARLPTPTWSRRWLPACHRPAVLELRPRVGAEDAYLELVAGRALAVRGRHVSRFRVAGRSDPSPGSGWSG